MSDEKLLDKFTPRQAFVAGVVLTLLSFGTLGFLWSLIGSRVSGSSASADPRPSVADARPSEPSGSLRAGDATVRPVDERDHVRGASNAAITLIEYADFECPYCGEFHPTLKRLLSEMHGVRWVYRHYPLSSMHPDAQQAAEASECAAEQGEFWAMADEMFENQSRGLSRPLLSTYAAKVGLDVPEFERCLEEGRYASEVRADAAEAEAVGAGGTPFTVIVADGGRARIPGAVSLTEIRETIDSLR